MKILFVTAWYPNEDNPAAGIFIQEHAKAVSMCGDKVVLVYSRRGEIRSKGLYKVLDTLEEGIRTLRIYYSPSPFRSVNYLIYLFSILSVCSKVIRGGFRPEIIHANIYTAGVPAAILGGLFKIPVVLSEHWSGYAQRKLGIAQRIQARFGMGRAAIILPVSAILKKHIEFYGIKGKFQVIPNTVDPTLFYPSNENRQGTDQKRILFVGLLTAIKGIPYLLQAASKLRHQREDWHLDIVGDGPERAKYETLAKELGLGSKVTFHGLKSKREVSERMRRADFLVLPSLWENSPCVILEAMASGLPIVSTRVGGIPEIVDEEIGVLVPPGDSNKLAEALSGMIESLPRFDRAAIGKKADAYRPETVGRLIHSVYESCVRG